MNKVFIFDIDGTLADGTHRQHYVMNKPKNWKTYNELMHLDKLHHDIYFMFQMFYNTGNTMLICTGREETHRATTGLWLKQNGIYPEQVFMRPIKDYRPDDVIKVEMLQEIRAKYGEPFLWFDDRQRVVDAIRNQGVRVLQVAPGDF